MSDNVTNVFYGVFIAMILAAIGFLGLGLHNLALTLIGSGSYILAFYYLFKVVKAMKKANNQ